VAWNKPGHTPGEPIFVADPAKTGEDDGVVLSVVLDGVSGRSYLLVLDAKNWVEVGRAEVPVAVGFGFHGAHVRL
jgi:torulene dioxygenase